MLIASLILLAYPNIMDVKLWLWLATFLGMITWPDLDVKFELRHREYTHTLAGALIFGAAGALIFARR